MQTRQEFIRLAAGLALAVLFVSVAARAAQKPKEWNPVIDPGNFVSVVDNTYFPLIPGQVLRYREKNGDEALTVEVTSQTRTVMGVPTIVVRETSTEGGQTVEISENWFAQDRDGNVWYFGEATQTFENGAPLSTEGSWEAGVAGALPGIIMQGSPQAGETYFQEYSPGIAEDMATVLDVGRTEGTALRTFANVLRTKEWTTLEPNSLEHKFYAPGIGLILERHGNTQLELVATE